MSLVIWNANAHAQEAPSPSPSPSVTPTPSPLVVRWSYDHTLGNPNYHGDPENGITFEPSAGARFTLDAALSNTENPIYLGIGYQFLGKLFQDGFELDQSPNKLFLELGGEYAPVSIFGVEPRIGLAVQFFPGFLSTHPDPNLYPNEIQFQYGAGFKVYAGLHFLKEYMVSMGYEGLNYAYKQGPGSSELPDFFLSHYSFFFSISAGF